MRGVVLMLVQLAISLLVVGAVLPVVLFAVPAARGPGIGLSVAGTMLVGMFVVLRTIWPAYRA